MRRLKNKWEKGVMNECKELRDLLIEVENTSDMRMIRDSKITAMRMRLKHKRIMKEYKECMKRNNK